MIIIVRFGENNVFCPKYIDIYEFLGVMGGDIHGPLYNFCLLLKKTENVQEHDLCTNQILHYFDLSFFS